MNTKNITFEELNIGDKFYKHSTVWVKTNPILDSIFSYNAIDPKTGDLCDFSKNEIVQRV